MMLAGRLAIILMDNGQTAHLQQRLTAIQKSLLNFGALLAKKSPVAVPSAIHKNVGRPSLTG
jgi:hypothetical protein